MRLPGGTQSSRALPGGIQNSCERQKMIKAIVCNCGCMPISVFKDVVRDMKLYKEWKSCRAGKVRMFYHYCRRCGLKGARGKSLQQGIEIWNRDVLGIYRDEWDRWNEILWRHDKVVYENEWRRWNEMLYRRDRWWKFYRLRRRIRMNPCPDIENGQ